MIVDVNILLYAADRESTHHSHCRHWLEDAFNGTTRVGLPWPTILAFLRIATHHRIMKRPLTVHEAWSFIDDWMSQSIAWIPTESPHHLSILRDLTTRYELTAKQIPDAHLAALAIGHGVPIVSSDTDFARFLEITWVNPAR